MSHTPGPWRSFEAGSEGCYIKRNTGNAKEDMQTLALVGHREALENRANARLIAAAPELLEALKDIEKHHVAINGKVGRGQEFSATLRIARAAIAKATGGAQ